MSTRLTTGAERRLNVGELKIADLCLVFFAISCIGFDDGSSVAKMSRVAILIGAFFELKDRPVRFNGYLAWLASFALLVFVSRFWAFNVIAATELFPTVLYNSLCFACAAYLLWKDMRRIKLVMVCMIAGSLILEARVIAAAGVFAFLGGARSTGSISANTVGMFSSFAAFIAYGLYREGEKKQKVYLVFCTMDVCFALLSASRKALMVMCLVVLLLVLFGKSKIALFGKLGKLSVALMAVLIVAFLVMNVPFLYELIGVRMEGMINGFFGMGAQVDASTKTRMNLVEYGMDWFYSSPIIGYGADNFRALMAAYHPGQTAYYAHNNYVELLVSYGVVGTAIYYAIYVAILARGIKRVRRLPYTFLVLLCLALGLLVMDYGMVEYYSRDAQLFIMLSWSALVGLYSGIPDCPNDK